MEALADEQPVTAAYLQYSLTEENGRRTAEDDVAYWGERPMLPHIFRFLALRGVVAEVTIASVPIRFTAGTRKLVAAEARRAVCLLREGRLAKADSLERVG